MVRTIAACFVALVAAFAAVHAASPQNIAHKNAAPDASLGAPLPGPVPTGCPAATFLYVGVWSPSRIYRFAVDCTTGQLTAEGYRSAPADARDMAVSPDGTELFYAAIGLTKYDISTNGTLTQVGTVQVGNGMFDDVLLDSTGAFLYGTHSQGPPNGGKLLAFDVASAALPVLLQEVFGPIGPHGLAIDPAGEQVYIANQTSFVTFPPDTAEIGIFPRNTGTGTIDPGGYGFTGWDASPNYFAVDPTGAYLYFTQTPPGDVIVGELVGGAVDAAPLCSAEFSGVGATQLVIDPTGTRLYVANVGESTVSFFTIDPGSGCITREQVIAAGGKPEHLVFGPDASFLYVASPGNTNGSSQVRVFAVAADGTLSIVETKTIADQGAYRLAIAAQF